MIAGLFSRYARIPTMIQSVNMIVGSESQRGSMVQACGAVTERRTLRCWFGSVLFVPHARL
jgi:hypothetical protein